MHSVVEKIDSAPIILIGLPRSGTTWIGKIFDSHPETLYLHEPDSAILITELPLVVSPAHENGARILSPVLTRTLSLRFARVVGVFPHFSKSYRTPPRDWFHRQLALGAKISSPLLGEISVPDLITPGCSARIVWKSVESLGRLGLIARTMPDARIIHIVRHPGGWITSYARGRRERRFHSGDRDEFWAFELLESTPAAKRRGLTIASFQGMSDLERDVWAWVLWNEQASEACTGLGNVMMIRYEDVCAAPVDESKRIFQFAQLTWASQTENFIQRSTSTHSDQFYSVFRDPQIAANLWRRSISPDDLEVIESILQGSAIGRSYLGTDGRKACISGKISDAARH
jgi:hypothetical protein